MRQITKHLQPGKLIIQLEGYLLIPHELLHVLGYKLAGKQCHYQWGNRFVTPTGPMTRDERLVGLLFPFAVCLITWFILLPIPFVALFMGSLTWAIILTIIPMIPLFYAFTAMGDLRQAYLLIYNKKPQDRTPLDFLFWPILTDNPKRVQASALIVMTFVLCLYAIYLLFF